MKRTIFATVIAGSLLLVPLTVFAQQTVIQQNGTTNSVPAVSTGQAGCGANGSSYTVCNPLGSSSVCGLIKNLLQAAIAIGIPIAVLFIVYAGFKFVLAQGKPEDLVKARKNLMWTIVGIAIFLGAWLLASVVANTINALQAGSGNASIISCQ